MDLCSRSHSSSCAFDASLSDLDLDFWSQECEKAETSVPIISQMSLMIWMDFCMPQRHIGLMNLTIILSH